MNSLKLFDIDSYIMCSLNAYVIKLNHKNINIYEKITRTLS